MSRGSVVATRSHSMTGRSMRSIASRLLIGLVFSLAWTAGTGAAPPNLIVILSDDRGRGDYGAFRTPAIDRLFREGMDLRNFHASCPVCSPTRAALRTGCCPDRVGVPGVIRTHAEDFWGFLSPRAVLLPRVLKYVCYYTALIGKWHLGLESPSTPTERGFDAFRGFLGDISASGRLSGEALRATRTSCRAPATDRCPSSAHVGLIACCAAARAHPLSRRMSSPAILPLRVALLLRSMVQAAVEFVDLSDDSLLQRGCPGGGVGPAVAHRLSGLVPPFLADSTARDVTHHVVTVASDPDGCLARELSLEPERIVHARLAADGGQHEVVAEADDLHGARVARGEFFPSVEPGEEAPRVVGLRLVLG